ncbi:hypothetical protein ACSBR2_015484 [Camellia fascicularis]
MDDGTMNLGCANSKNSIDQSVSETLIIIRSASSTIDVECGGEEKGKFDEEDLSGEGICRICHLSSDPSSLSKAPRRTKARTITTTTTTDTTTIATSSSSAATTSDGLNLIELGCGCKDELGIVHAHCAEAWFKLKGNRQCEICGKAAENITEVENNRFMEKWNETRSLGVGAGVNLPDNGIARRRNRTCYFVIIGLLLAFLLSWSISNY